MNSVKKILEPVNNLYIMKYKCLLTDKENKTEESLLSIQDIIDILKTFGPSYLITRIDEKDLEAHNYEDYLYLEAPKKVIDIVMETLGK